MSTSLDSLTPPRGAVSHGMAHGTLFLMLSIYLILLSFFILLNTLASGKHEDPTATHPTSFSGFENIPNHNGTGNQQATWTTGPLQVITIHTELTGLVQGVFRLSTPPLETTATAATATLPLARVLGVEKDKTTPTPEGTAFLGNLAQLATQNKDWHLTLTVQQPTGTPAQRAASLLALQKAAAWPPNATLRMAAGSPLLAIAIHPGASPSPRTLNQLERTLPTGTQVQGHAE